MSFLYLFILVLVSGMVTVIVKFYNKRNEGAGNASGLYNILFPVGAAITYFIAYSSELAFEPRVLIYSLLYGFFYTLFTIGMSGSIRVGISSITALVKQTALVGVSIWGFFFFSVPVTVNAVIGVSLIFVSLCLCLIEKGKKTVKKDFRLPFYLSLIAMGNIGCPITHKYLLIHFEGKHGYMMLFFAVLFASAFSMLSSLKGSKKGWGKITVSSGFLPILAGVCSAMAGIMQTILINKGVSTSVIYPTFAVGGLMVTLIFSIFAFNERLRTAQWYGIAVGAVALVLLNI